jgi:hypothetical protein
MEEIKVGEEEAVNRPERCHVEDQVPESGIGL